MCLIMFRKTTLNDGQKGLKSESQENIDTKNLPVLTQKSQKSPSIENR